MKKKKLNRQSPNFDSLNINMNQIKRGDFNGTDCLTEIRKGEQELRDKEIRELWDK
jgi:hypothetical protein